MRNITALFQTPAARNQAELSQQVNSITLRLRDFCYTCQDGLSSAASTTDMRTHLKTLEDDVKDYMNCNAYGTYMGDKEIDAIITKATKLIDAFDRQEQAKHTAIVEQQQEAISRVTNPNAAFSLNGE